MITVFHKVPLEMAVRFTNDKGELINHSSYHILMGLLEFTSLKYSKVRPDAHSILVYCAKKGVYEEISFKRLLPAVGSILDTFLPKPHKAVTLSVCEHLFMSQHCNSTMDEVPLPDWIACLNGHVRLSEIKVYPRSPERFITAFLDVNFPETDIPFPEFSRYLTEFSGGEDRLCEFIRAAFRAILMSYSSLQFYIFLYGKASTGKSVLSLVLQSIIPDSQVVITDMRMLNSNVFEGANLEGKKLIILNEEGKYQRSLSVLKALSGGDPLRSGEKYVQNTRVIYPSGIVLIISNFPPSIKDSDSDAIVRRLRLIFARNLPKEVRLLLDRQNGQWVGPISKERGAILRWVLQLSHSETVEHVRFNSFMDNEKRSVLMDSDPMSSFITEYCVLDDKCNILVGRRGSERSLYHAYTMFLEGQDLKSTLSGNIFRDHVIRTVKIIYNVQLQHVKTNKGRSIKGISVNWDKLNDTSSEKITYEVQENPNPYREESDTAKEIPFTTSVPIIVEENPFLGTKYNSTFYDEYLGLLNNSPLKETISGMCINHLPSPEIILQKDMSGRVSTSPDFKDALLKRIELNLHQLRSSGNFIPLVYYRKNKPRLYAKPSRGSLSSVKSSIKSHILSDISVLPEINGISIVELDVRGCFMGVLQGLFRKETTHLRVRLEQFPSVWDYIQDDFSKKGFLHLYNKKSAKICLYATFFSGGVKAYTNALLQKKREEMGITQVEFDSLPSYDVIHQEASQFADSFKKSSLPKMLQNLSKDYQRNNLGKTMYGPGGYQFVVNQDTFRTDYSLLFQSYESALVMTTLIGLKKEFPEMEILLHQHDGVTISIPDHQYKNLLNQSNEILNKSAKGLHLDYEFHFDAKKYGPVEI